MILYYLLQGFRNVLKALGSVLPDGSKLPTIGTLNLDTFVSTGVGYIRGLAGIFPPLATLIACASIYLGFKLLMMIFKAIFGSRAPQHSNN